MMVFDAILVNGVLTSFDFGKTPDCHQYDGHLDNYWPSILVWDRCVGDQVKIPE